MIKFTLPQVIHCKEKGYGITKIDCQHWSANDIDCKQFCSLKNIQVNKNFCSKCDVRKPLTPAQELKNLMPQKNIYTTSEKGIQFSENILTEQQNKSFSGKALSYSKVEGSQLIQGKVSEEVFNKRKDFCMSCPQRTNPSPELEAIGWCKGCGCSSKNPRAGLTNKLWMPNWECPEKKFGKENGQGFNVSDAANSLKGIVTSVASLFKGDGNT